MENAEQLKLEEFAKLCRYHLGLEIDDTGYWGSCHTIKLVLRIGGKEEVIDTVSFTSAEVGGYRDW